MNKKTKATPFVKWVGGKGQLAGIIQGLVPAKINRYYEPFVGGGAIFFNLQEAGLIKSSESFLSDINPNLLDTYTIIRDDVDSLIMRLAQFGEQADNNFVALQDMLKNDPTSKTVADYKAYLKKQESLTQAKLSKPPNPKFIQKIQELQDVFNEINLSLFSRKMIFDELKNADRRPEFSSWSKLERAARFIFLNKTGFNGVYRENSKGYFNTPFGDQKNPNICDRRNLINCNDALRGVSIDNKFYYEIELDLQEGDFVYLDPPYVPLSSTSNFTGYTSSSFGIREQIRLRNMCNRLDKKGIKFMQSNSSAEVVKRLYKNFTIEEVDATRAINSDASGRGTIKEVIITNYTDFNLKPYSF